MGEFLPFLFIGAVLVLIVGGIIWSIVAEKKRREALMETADQMGLTFFKEGDPDLLSQLSSFKLFSQGRARKMKNLIQGDSGEVKIAIFDYQYTTGSGKQTKTTQQSVALINSIDLICPDFRIRPEGLLDKIGGAMGFQNIDFETHPKFSGLFVLQGSSEEEIRKYFTPNLIEFFEQKPGISVQANSGTMFFFRPGKRIKPAELKDLLAQAYEVFGVMVDQA
jgi:hypothetical protein